MSSLLELARSVVAADETLAAAEILPGSPSFERARRDASERYFGLRDALSLFHADSLVDVLIQLGEAQAAVERLASVEGDAQCEQHIQRLLFSCIDVVEQFAGTDLDREGLGVLRARYRNPWASGAERQAALEAVR
jgi:hypothetical protein